MSLWGKGKETYECKVFVYRMVSAALKGAVVVLVMSVCASCAYDNPPSWSLRPDDFVWSERATDSPDRHANAYYCNDGGQYWVVLIWKGSGQIGPLDQIVLLCIEERVEGKSAKYSLEYGLALQTWFLARRPSVEGKIVRLRVLKKEFFRGECHSGKISLAYSGEVSGKSNFDEGTDMNRLRFEVKAKKNRRKIVSVVEKVYPLMEKEPYAGEVVECFARLVEAQSE